MASLEPLVLDDVCHTLIPAEAITTLRIKPDSSLGGHRKLVLEDVDVLAALEQTREDLLNKREDIDEQIRAESEIARDVHLQYQKDVLGFHGDIEDLFGAFKDLDRRIGSLSAALVHIGEQLHGLDSSRKRAATGQRLLSNLFAFLEGDVPVTLDSEGVTELPDLLAAASSIQKLAFVTRDLRVANISTAREGMSRTAAEIETKLLEWFSLLLQDANLEHEASLAQLQQCAQTLLQFEGQRICQEYVFNAVTDLTQHSAVDFPSLHALQIEVRSLFEHILTIIVDEYDRVLRIFVGFEDVLIKQLLERVFQDNVLCFLDKVMSFRDRDDEERLQILEIVFDEMQDLLSKLREPLEDLPSHYAVTIGLVLEGQSAEVFGSYRGPFMEMQLKVLKETCAAPPASPRTDAHEHLGLTARLATAIRREDVTEPCAALQADLAKVPGVLDAQIERHSVALRRCGKLSELGELAVNVHAVFAELLGSLLEEYIEGLWTRCEKELEDSGKAGVLVLELVHHTDLAVQAVEVFFGQQVQECVSADTNIEKQCFNLKARILSRVEKRVLQGLSSVLDAECALVSRVLAKEQKKSDYRPKDNNIPDATKSTKACTEATKVIHAHYKHALEFLHGKNLDSYLTALGFRVYDLLLTHLQKYVFSMTGAMLLIKDVRDYQLTVRQFNLPVLDDAFETLQALANVFMVPKDSVPLLVSENPKLNKLDPALIQSFVHIRADHKAGFQFRK